MNNSCLLLLLACVLTCDLVCSRCPVTSLPDNWMTVNVPGSNFCYALATVKANRAVAREKCWMTFRGHLARFHDVESLEKLAGNLKANTKRIWTDLVSVTQGDTQRWMWSDGGNVDEKVLSARSGKDATPSEAPVCGALTDSVAKKFSKWTSEECQTNHEYICQAPKVLEPSSACSDSSFELNGECYALPSKLLAFDDAKSECKVKFQGSLAALDDRELLVTTANYLEYGQEKIGADGVRIWLDIKWNGIAKTWQHGDGRKVTAYEENWNQRNDKANGDNRSYVVVDQSVDWKWKTRKSEWKAYALCHVGALDAIAGKALPVPTKPDIDLNPGSNNRSTTTQERTTFGGIANKGAMDFKTLLIIVGGIGVVLFIVLLVVCILCWKKKVCCLQKRKKEVTGNGFGTPVSFSFMNPEYGNTVSTVPRPHGDTPTNEPRLLPAPPLEEEDETYATINEARFSPPASTIDLLNTPVSQYNSLNAATTLPRNRVSPEPSSSLARSKHYSARISTNTLNSSASIASRDPVPTPIHGRQMTSFMNASPRFPVSPKYAEMGNTGSRKETPSHSEPTALQYAELTFGHRDEDDQFAVGGPNESTYVANTGSMTRHRFQAKYPSINGTLPAANQSNPYENEPLVVSPDSPQFPFQGRALRDST